MCASSSLDESAKLWHLDSGELAAKPLAGHSDGVLAIASNAAQSRLATASADRTVRLWDLVSHKRSPKFTGHADAVAAVAFSADDRYLASGSDDAEVIVWDFATRNIVARLSVNAWSESPSMFSVRFIRGDRAVVAILHDGASDVLQLPHESDDAVATAQEPIFAPDFYDFAWVVDCTKGDDAERVLWLPNRYRCDEYMMASWGNYLASVGRHGDLLVVRIE